MKKLLLRSILLWVVASLWAQETAAQKSWTEVDRKILIGNFIRTKAEVHQETASLTSAQWNFKEAPSKWNIAEVLEHLYNWSLITQQNVRYSFMLGENVELAKRSLSDSAVTTFIYEERPHVSPDHTIPTGLITEGNNLKIFNVKYDEIINAIKTSDKNFRLYFKPYDANYQEDIVQQYIIHYGHVDRHLRQIRRIKSHPNYPK
jgi:DinB superfamily